MALRAHFGSTATSGNVRGHFADTASATGSRSDTTPRRSPRLPRSTHKRPGRTFLPKRALSRLRTIEPLLFVALVSATLIGSAFIAKGGLQLEPTSYVEIAFIFGGATLVVLALLFARSDQPFRLYGGWALFWFAALAVLTALSIRWSITPADSWYEASRTFAHLAVFAGGLALARLAPSRWPQMLHGISIGCVCVCGYALLTKVFPNVFAADEVYARLREPFQYWNAVGIMAALGVPPLLWLAARRSGHLAVNALAWPGLGILMMSLMLAYSRGALLALGVGLALWFIVVPLRLRSLMALSAATIAVAPIIAWAFSNRSLTSDHIALADRVSVGHDLGIFTLVMLLMLLLVGLGVNFSVALGAPGQSFRKFAGRTVGAALLALALTGTVALASAPGGITGQAWKTWKQMVNPASSTPANTPDRLLATSSVRAQYWKEAGQIFAGRKATGTGAGSYVAARTRYRTNTLSVRHAHGYVVQTMSDLGVIGLGVSVFALLAWVIAALRTTGLRRRDRGLPFDAERIGMITMLVVVVVFGVHSLVDWTWFVPANAVVALLCAGWLAGRGPVRLRLAGSSLRARAEINDPSRRRYAASDATLDARNSSAIAPLEGGVCHSPSDHLNESFISARTQSEVSPGAGNTPTSRLSILQSLVKKQGIALLTGAVLTVSLASVAAWATLQPVRSLHAQDAAIDRAHRGDLKAAADIAQLAVKRNPFATEALWQLSSIEAGRGHTKSAQTALERAVTIQPANAENWRQLGHFHLKTTNNRANAKKAFQTARTL